MAASADAGRRRPPSKRPKRRIARRRDAGLAGSGRIRWDRVGRIGFLLLVAVLLISYIGPLIDLTQSYRLAGSTRAELQKVTAEHEDLERGTKHLQSEMVVEREARRQGMVIPGEQPYVVNGLDR